MPTTETLERFIATVERNDHAGALESFYAPNASMQENQSAPRVGRDAHVANERRVLAKAKSFVVAEPMITITHSAAARKRRPLQRVVRPGPLARGR